MEGEYEPDNIDTRTQVRPWQCDSCGLIHNHFPGVRHSLNGMAAGPAFVVSNLEYNPDCHCGIHEMVERVKVDDVALPSGLKDHITHLDQKLALPEETKQEIEEVVDGGD